uniref:ribonuclease H n=1 Tax=Leptobrachium leishanense TaxID=445787 RepID=A0A8C5M2W2_9ANUR
MERTLKNIPGVCLYFDDVLIAGESASVLAERLRAVLRFREAGLKLKREKCRIGVESTDFLGFRIDAAGIHPSEVKLQPIQQAPTPKSKGELQAFLGLLNFYHSFLPHKAALAEPLHCLLDKQAPWVWSSTQNKAFSVVKSLLSSDSVLVHFNETLPVTLACDASPYSIGAVLSHRMPDGREAPVTYYSRTLSPAERNYAQIDKEALAIVAGIKKFHDFLYGRTSTIFTDHKPLLGLFTADKQTPQILSPRMLRWSIFMAVPLSYKVTLGNDCTIRRHIDQLRRRLTGPVPDGNPRVFSDTLENCVPTGLPTPPVSTSEEAEVLGAVEPSPLTGDLRDTVQLEMDVLRFGKTLQYHCGGPPESVGPQPILKTMSVEQTEDNIYHRGEGVLCIVYI